MREKKSPKQDLWFHKCMSTHFTETINTVRLPHDVPQPQCGFSTRTGFSSFNHNLDLRICLLPYNRDFLRTRALFCLVLLFFTEFLIPIKIYATQRNQEVTTENERRKHIQEIKFQESVGRIPEYSWIILQESVLRCNRAYRIRLGRVGGAAILATQDAGAKGKLSHRGRSCVRGEWNNPVKSIPKACGVRSHLI